MTLLIPYLFTLCDYFNTKMNDKIKICNRLQIGLQSVVIKMQSIALLGLMNVSKRCGMRHHE